MSIFLTGLLSSLLAGLATALGAIPIFFTKEISHKLLDNLMGFAAGIMLSASFFSLILPSLEYGGNNTKAAVITALGIILGSVLIDLVDHYSPHEHLLHDKSNANNDSIKKVWLFIIAFTIHNFPEGMAVGVGFGGHQMNLGYSVAIGIGLQNIPEGLSIALALKSLGYSSKKVFLITLLTGLVEPIGGLFGSLIVSSSAIIVPFALSFAAGAMLFVVSHEIIPDTHHNGFERSSTYALIIGFIMMMVLDVIL